MKKNNLFILSIALLFTACKHEPIIPDAEYLNQAAYDKIAEFMNAYTPSSHDVFSIGFWPKDTTLREELIASGHISHKHTLDSMRVNDNPWFKLMEHYGSSVINTTLTSNVDQTVSFQIKSKTPLNEVMSGEVTIPKKSPIKAVDLGNNTFKITWQATNRRERVLIYLSYFRVYVQRLNNAYAVETEDDGEFILTPSVFEQFKELPQQFPSSGTTESVKVGLIRIVPKRKTIIKQPSTGIEYSVFGGNGSDETIIDVLK